MRDPNGERYEGTLKDGNKLFLGCIWKKLYRFFLQKAAFLLNIWLSNNIYFSYKHVLQL